MAIAKSATMTSLKPNFFFFCKSYPLVALTFWSWRIYHTQRPTLVNLTTANGPMFKGVSRRFFRAKFCNKSIDIGEVLPLYVPELHCPKFDKHHTQQPSRLRSQHRDTSMCIGASSRSVWASFRGKSIDIDEVLLSYVPEFPCPVGWIVKNLISTILNNDILLIVEAGVVL